MKSSGRGRAQSDEFYVVDLCDEALGEAGLRQHRFPWLLGDPSPKTGRATALPVDAYWPSRSFVVEFYERQHTEAVAFFDKPDRITVSGVPRGEQRALYDERRRQLIPQHGLRLVVIPLEAFENKRGKIVRNHDRDLDAVAMGSFMPFRCAGRDAAGSRVRTCPCARLRSSEPAVRGARFGRALLRKGPQPAPGASNA